MDCAADGGGRAEEREREERWIGKFLSCDGRKKEGLGW